ncbi:MAG: alanine racemase [Desulfobacteraceae bacterium]|nr:alanine racemase [Desulfobacteraceae bacterium]
MSHSLNRVEIDLGALRHNYRALQEQAGKGAEVLAMVKADAYGHGLVPVARTLAAAGARTFGVAEIEEGIALRQAGLEGEVIVLLGAPADRLDEVIVHRLSPVVFDLEMLAELSRRAVLAETRVDVHLKVDVGMGRLGILPPELPHFLDSLSRLPGVRLAGVSSHLPMADRPQAAVTREQCRLFMEIAARVRQASPEARFHLANSAAHLNLPETRLDMVRPGIALYGGQPGGPTAGGFRPVMSFRSRIQQVKEVPAGTGLSYGHTFVTSRPSRVAVLPVGYDDGLLRRLSNRAAVLIGGRRVPLRGNICMNACMADVTDLPAVRPGDEVVLLGRQGGEAITAGEIAGWLETIDYEVLCLVGGLNARLYVGAERGTGE